jgi:hypothetical protein
VKPGTRLRVALPVIGIAAGLTVSFVYQERKNRPIPFIDVYDGFETPKLGNLWETDKFEPGAVTMQSEIVVPTRLVLAQWKQDCHGHPPCANASPVVAIRYSSGTLQITHQIAEHRTPLYETREDVRGRWNDFRFRIRFTPRDDGVLQAWHNGRAVVDYHGVNAYPENAATGYASPSRFYFKMGLYRDVMDEPMTIYIDEYRKKQLP